MQTEGQQISENQVVFNIQEADNINHIVVFMTGQTPFPDGLGGAGTVNFLKILTPKKFVVITLKFEQCGSTIE